MLRLNNTRPKLRATNDTIERLLLDWEINKIFILYFLSFVLDFFQMTKEGVCPKESKQKEPSRPKYARRRQKFYIYS